MGLFTWWCIVDQRLSIWTTLIGPTVAIVLTLLVRPSFGLVYLLWIMLTRLITSTLLGLAWGRMNPLWPLLLYYNQVVGAALKSSINFRRSEEHTSELQSLMRISYAVFFWKKQNIPNT